MTLPGDCEVFVVVLLSSFLIGGLSKSCSIITGQCLRFISMTCICQSSGLLSPLI